MYLDISKVTLPTDAVTLNTQRYLKEFQHLDSAFLCFLSMFFLSHPCIPPHHRPVTKTPDFKQQTTVLLETNHFPCVQEIIQDQHN